MSTLPAAYRFALFAAKELLKVVSDERNCAQVALSAKEPFDWRLADERICDQMETVRQYIRPIERELTQATVGQVNLSGVASTNVFQLVLTVARQTSDTMSLLATCSGNATENDAFQYLLPHIAPISDNELRGVLHDLDGHAGRAAGKCRPRLKLSARDGGSPREDELNVEGLDWVCQLLWGEQVPELLPDEVEWLRKYLAAPPLENCPSDLEERVKLAEILCAAGKSKRGKADDKQDAKSILRQRAEHEFNYRKNHRDYIPQRDAKTMRAEFDKKHGCELPSSAQDFANARKRFPLNKYPWQ